MEQKRIRRITALRRAGRPRPERPVRLRCAIRCCAHHRGFHVVCGHFSSPVFTRVTITGKRNQAPLTHTGERIPTAGPAWRRSPRDNQLPLVFATDSRIGRRAAPYPRRNRSLAGDEYAPLMIGTCRLRRLAANSYFESVSFDEIENAWLAATRRRCSAPFGI